MKTDPIDAELDRIRKAQCQLLDDIGSGRLKPKSKAYRDKKRALDRDMAVVRKKIENW